MVEQTSTTPDGKPRVAVDIESGEHPWCTINLADGNRIRVQMMVTRVYRVDGEVDPDGIPRYDIESAPIMRAFPRKKGK